MAEQPTTLITLAQVRHVAHLSRLALDDQALGRLSGELAAILEYVAQIGRVDTTGVEPMAHVLPLTNVLREDTPGQALPLEQVLANAPATDGPFFKVPKIIGGDEDSAG
jgi:aspartyl-tRNA(Asn)/glutamyl-tRNA(Gln) amidotransferase subunit C